MVLCHRCGEAVGEGADFCPHCGAPQLYLAVEDSPDEAQAATAGTAATARPGMVEWTVALGCAGLVALAGLAMFVAANWVPLLAVLSFVWILSEGQLVVDLYRRRRPQARLDGRVGARIGAATGVLVGGARTVAAALTGIIERYGLHHGAAMSAEYAQGISSVQQMMQKLTGQPMPAEQLRQMLSPQYHAAIVVVDVAMAWLLVLVVAIAGGAFTGFLHGRRRRMAS
jgi:hypothetical protein